MTDRYGSERRNRRGSLAKTVLALGSILLLCIATQAGCGSTSSSSAGKTGTGGSTLQSTTPPGTARRRPDYLGPALWRADHARPAQGRRLRPLLRELAAARHPGSLLARLEARPRHRRIVEQSRRPDTSSTRSARTRTFWDGNPVTVDDVVFSLKRNMDPKTGSIWAAFLQQRQEHQADRDLGSDRHASTSRTSSSTRRWARAPAASSRRPTSRRSARPSTARA